MVTTDPGRRPLANMQIGGRQRRLPVVGVDDLGLERRDRAEPDVGAYARKCSEAAGIVGPVESVGAEIRVAWPVVEVGCVDREKVETACLAGEHARWPAEKVRIIARDRRVGELVLNRRVAGNQRPHLDAFGA